MNLSRMLREAVVAELDRSRAMEKLAEGSKEYLLDLETRDGEPYKGRIVGTLLSENRRGERLFATEDERVIFYDPNRPRHDVLEDEDEIREAVETVCGTTDEFIWVMAKLGLTATVDL